MSIETDGDLIELREAGDVTRETLDALEFYTDKKVTISRHPRRRGRSPTLAQDAQNGRSVPTRAREAHA